MIERKRSPKMQRELNESAINRRAVLRSAGVALALPFLRSHPLVGANTEREYKSHAAGMILVSNNLGVLPKKFFPSASGRNYEPSPYLKEIEAYRNDFTIFSGLSHPGVEGGHSTENCFLTAARGPTKSGFRNQISFDQLVAEEVGYLTRFPTLNLGVNIDKANRSLSWTRDGALLPVDDSAQSVFKKMFLQGDSSSVQRELNRLEERGSVLDSLLDDTRSVYKTIGISDRTRLDQYLTSIREVETRLASLKQWEMRDKPLPTRDAPADIPDQKLLFEKFDLMLSMAQLAIESDSTRIVTLMVDAFATPVFKLPGGQESTDGYHNLSHHGQEPAKLSQLEESDRRQMQLLSKLFSRLAQTPYGDKRLFDRTMVLFGSNMGDSNTHDNTNLPILLAGGGFHHGQHVMFPQNKNRPLSNLFVTMAQRMGLPMDSFGSSNGSIAELE